VPTNTSGLFAHSISSDVLVKGLTHDENIARGKDYLIQSSQAVGYAGSLATVPDLSEAQIDTSGIDAVWPFPQIAQCQQKSFVFTQSGIYTLNDGGQLELRWAAQEPRYNRWTVSDFTAFIVMSNGYSVLQYELFGDIFQPCESWDNANNSGVPRFVASCNFGGQLIIGGVHQ